MLSNYLANSLFVYHDRFADWLQTHLIPETLKDGKLTLEEAIRVTENVISKEQERIREWISKGIKSELMKTAYELWTNFDNRFCPVCATKKSKELDYVLQIPVLHHSVMYPHLGNLLLGRPSLIATTKNGEAPESNLAPLEPPVQITSFKVGIRTYYLWTANIITVLRTPDYKPIYTHPVHKVIIYKNSPN